MSSDEKRRRRKGRKRADGGGDCVYTIAAVRREEGDGKKEEKRGKEEGLDFTVQKNKSVSPGLQGEGGRAGLILSRALLPCKSETGQAVDARGGGKSACVCPVESIFC